MNFLLGNILTFFTNELLSVHSFYSDILNFDARPGRLNLAGCTRKHCFIRNTIYFLVQPSTETSLSLHVLSCLVKVLFYFVKFIVIGGRTIAMYGYPNKIIVFIIIVVIIITVVIIIVIVIIITTIVFIIMFNVISHRAEILVSLVFAARADINQMSKISQQYPFLGT